MHCVSPSIKSMFLKQVLLCLTGLHWRSSTAYASNGNNMRLNSHPTRIYLSPFLHLFPPNPNLSLPLSFSPSLSLNIYVYWSDTKSTVIGIHENRQMWGFICQSSFVRSMMKHIMNMNMSINITLDMTVCMSRCEVGIYDINISVSNNLLWMKKAKEKKSLWQPYYMTWCWNTSFERDAIP